MGTGRQRFGSIFVGNTSTSTVVSQSTRAVARQGTCTGNEACEKLAKAHPDHFVFGANEVPDLPGAPEVVEKYLKAGAVVIGEQKFGVACDSPEMEKLYALAEAHRVPILMHWQHTTYNSGFERFGKMLEKHPKVEWVSYAGLPSSKYYALHKKICPKGAGAVFTFGLKGGYEAGVAFVSNLRLFSHLANIGDTRSLVIHPASTTHRQLTDEQRKAAGAGPDVVRLSIGIEDKDDIIADLEQALAQV